MGGRFPAWQAESAIVKVDQIALRLLFAQKRRTKDPIRAFKKISRQDLTANLLKTLKTLSSNEEGQKRFVDAARQYWSMAIEQLKSCKDLKVMNEQTTKNYKKYTQLKKFSEIYYVYNAVAEFVETPFFTSSDAALDIECLSVLNYQTEYSQAALHQCLIYLLPISQSGFEARGLQNRACYDKLSHLIVNRRWAEQMELGNLSVRSKPFSDKDIILRTFLRFSMANPIISDKNACFNCKHPFVIIHEFRDSSIGRIQARKRNYPFQGYLTDQHHQKSAEISQKGQRQKMAMDGTRT